MSWPTINMEEMIETRLIKLGRGKVISKLDIASCPGSFPIYSSASLKDGKFGEYGQYEFDQELITWSVDGGGKFFYRPKHKFSVTNVAGTLEIMDTKKLNYEFLYYALTEKHSRLTFDWIRKAHPSVIRRLYTDIPLPPIGDQERVVYLLRTVEGLIAQRKQHLQHLDDFLKSVFLDMFGDPVRNEKNWRIELLGSLCEVQGGIQVTSKRKSLPIEVPYLRVANVYRDRLNLTEIKMIKVTEAELERVRLREGDLLIVEGHGNPNEIGRSAIWTGSINECVHQNHLIRVRVDTTNISGTYTSFFINSAGGRKQMFKAGKTTSGLNTISSKNVKE